MNAEIYDDLALEQNAKIKFGRTFDVKNVIVRGIPVSYTSHATVFLTQKKELMVYIDGESRLHLSDVKKIISRMGLVAELYIPPKGQINYFDSIARDKYREVFPARHNPSDDDLTYYRTLAPYHPALVQILEVKNGEIYKFDTDAKGGWRVATKFAYRRIKAV